MIQKNVFLKFHNKDIICIGGNENVDSAAKCALELPHAKAGVPYTNFKHCIIQYILSTWQDHWNGAVVNKLHFVKPVLGDSYSYILKKDHPPQCSVFPKIELQISSKMYSPNKNTNLV